MIIQLICSTESGGKQPYQYNRIYDANGISPCLDTDRRSPAILVVPEATSKGYTEIKPGECFDFEHQNQVCIQQRARGQNKGGYFEDKTPTLSSSSWEHNNVLHTENYRIRRLTPTECARLQTIPEWYVWKCSSTQQYKLLGNGWNIETVKHILKFMK